MKFGIYSRPEAARTVLRRGLDLRDRPNVSNYCLRFHELAVEVHENSSPAMNIQETKINSFVAFSKPVSEDDP